MTALVFNVLIVVGWLVWSFLFWRSLRHEAVDEDLLFEPSLSCAAGAHSGCACPFTTSCFGIRGDRGICCVLYHRASDQSPVGDTYGKRRNRSPSGFPLCHPWHHTCEYRCLSL